MRGDIDRKPDFVLGAHWKATKETSLRYLKLAVVLLGGFHSKWQVNTQLWYDSKKKKKTLEKHFLV